MLKLAERLKIVEGTRIYITEDWHDSLKEFTKAKEHPYEFEVVESCIMEGSKGIYYI